MHAINPQSGSSFGLKWVMGTTVSRCYGCGGEILNPPQAVPDDLVIVHKDIRQYRDQNTGQIQFTREPQNVHFHLYQNAISHVIFDREHIERLANEFGLGCNCQ